ncbi:4'-phosphopantetheinyl transferase family protein [Streptomyces incarnatus]|uniref:4'-phosphopantetheinyl transferase family protein n=1 Tax=Streptomyces incarnatus TaxID=665007 RepID=UPI000A7BC276|nr:4'-phosphopantetheinyl transferase superfamily protein [Streptomyces incarnatus]
MEAAVAVRWAYAEADPRTRARELLRSVAAEVCAARPADVVLGRAASGRPELSGAAAGLCASVSHTRGVVAVAVTRPHTELSGIGVDVEAVRPLDAAGLATRWFTPGEASWVLSLPPALRPVGLLHLWTRKESAGKAAGRGLAGGGLRRPVGSPPPGTFPRTSRRLTRLPGDTDLAGTVLPGPPGYVLSCAGRGPAAGTATAEVTQDRQPRSARGPTSQRDPRRKGEHHANH